MYFIFSVVVTEIKVAFSKNKPIIHMHSASDGTKGTGSGKAVDPTPSLDIEDDKLSKLNLGNYWRVKILVLFNFSNANMGITCLLY